MPKTDRFHDKATHRLHKLRAFCRVSLEIRHRPNLRTNYAKQLEELAKDLEIFHHENIKSVQGIFKKKIIINIQYIIIINEKGIPRIKYIN